MILFLQYWRQSYSRLGLKIVFIYAIAIFLIEFFLYLDRGNLFLIQLITVVETLGFTAFLFAQINRRIVRRAVLLIGFAFVFSILLLFYINNQLKTIDSVQIGIETIIILVFSFFYLYERMNDTTTLYIYNSYHFWIVIGMVLYLSGSFFIYIYAGSLPNGEVNRYWFITNILSVIKNILFTVGIIVNSKKQKSSPTSSSDFLFGSLN